MNYNNINISECSKCGNSYSGTELSAVCADCLTLPLTFKQLQEEHRRWSTYNFDNQFPDPVNYYDSVFGCMEELGELAHALLKRKQNIRGSNEKHTQKAKDAVGDLTVFIASVCSALGFDYQEIIEDTWAEVSRRDYKKDEELKGEPAIEVFGKFTVNGEEFQSFTSEVSYEHICALSGHPPKYSPTVIAHWKGTEEDTKGSKILAKGMIIKVRDGMRFSVAYTGNA